MSNMEDRGHVKNAPKGIDALGRRRHNGHFQKGHKGGPGRPKGSGGVGPGQGKVERAVQERLRAIQERAEQNVFDAIDRGSLRASTWFLEYITKTQGTQLTAPLMTHIRQLDETGLLALSEEATRKVLAGELSEKQFKLVQDAIAIHGQRVGLSRINELREQLHALQERAKQASNTRLGLNGYTPLWGRFRKKPEEDGDQPVEIAEND